LDSEILLPTIIFGIDAGEVWQIIENSLIGLKKTLNDYVE
jgi:uncharacterized protein with HEPN domain